MFLISGISSNKPRIKCLKLFVPFQLKISRIIRHSNLFNDRIIYNLLLRVIFILIISGLFKHLFWLFMIIFLTGRNLLNTGVPFFCEVKELCTCNALENVLVLFFVSVVLRSLFAIAVKHFTILIWLCWLDKSSYIFCSKVWFKFNFSLYVIWNCLFFLFFSILLWLFLQRNQLTRLLWWNSLLISLYEPSWLYVFNWLTIIEPLSIWQDILLQHDPVRRLCMITRIAIIVPDYRRESTFVVFLIHRPWLYGWEASEVRVVIAC